MKHSKTFVFFGNVGAGKGTQVFFLKSFLERMDGQKVVYAYPGNEFRNIISNEGYTNGLTKEILNRGELLPVFLVSYVFGRILMNELEDPNNHLILDGFPRSIEQVRIFESAMSFYGRNNIEIIYLDITKEESVKRLKLRGRHDDTEEGIDRRFEEYEKNVLPALNHMREKGYKIHHINGQQHIDEVKDDVFMALGL